jgi:hypothetical protein
VQIYLFQDGKQTGPFSLQYVNQLLQQRKLNPSDLAWIEAWGDWRPVSNLPGVTFSQAMPKAVDLSGISAAAASKPNPKFAGGQTYASQPVQSYSPPAQVPPATSSTFTRENGIGAIVITGIIGFCLSWITCGVSVWIAVPVMILMAFATDWTGGQQSNSASSCGGCLVAFIIGAIILWWLCR